VKVPDSTGKEEKSQKLSEAKQHEVAPKAPEECKRFWIPSSIKNKKGGLSPPSLSFIHKILISVSEAGLLEALIFENFFDCSFIV
jgi:hypothetical protein